MDKEEKIKQKREQDLSFVLSWAFMDKEEEDEQERKQELYRNHYYRFMASIEYPIFLYDN